MSKAIEIAGLIFGRLKAVERCTTPHGGRDEAYWLCLCDCGAVKSVAGSKLRNGSTKSCGCLGLQNLKDHTDQKRKTPEEKKVFNRTRKEIWNRTKKGKEFNNKRQKRRIADLSNTYVKSLLCSASELSAGQIPTNLVSMKREQLTLARIAKQLKKAANETITEHP